VKSQFLVSRHNPSDNFDLKLEARATLERLKMRFQKCFDPIKQDPS
jgi:hypothetical protein